MVEVDVDGTLELPDTAPEPTANRRIATALAIAIARDLNTMGD